MMSDLTDWETTKEWTTPIHTKGFYKKMDNNYDFEDAGKWL